MQNNTKVESITIIYDGQCPFCSRYMHRVRLQKNVGKVDLVDARTQPELSAELLQKGYNLDTGMLVMFNNQHYYGADAIHFLALMGSQNNLFNTLNRQIFRHQYLAKVLYPLLKAVRVITLKVLNRGAIHDSSGNQ